MNQSIHHGLRPLAAAVVGAGALAAALAAGTAWAGNSGSFAESRGYHACVDAAERDAQIIKIESDYYIYDHDDARRYYLNGYAFADGRSQPVKIACDTTPSGHRLLGVSVDTGSYAGRVIQPVNVASK